MHLPRIEPFRCSKHAIVVTVLFRYPAFKVFGKFCALNLGVVPCSAAGRNSDILYLEVPIDRWPTIFRNPHVTISQHKLS